MNEFRITVTLEELCKKEQLIKILETLIKELKKFINLNGFINE